jgi:hypothetical protein
MKKNKTFGNDQGHAGIVGFDVDDDGLQSTEK